MAYKKKYRNWNISDPYIQGYQEYILENPYPKETENHRLWERGKEDAIKDNKNKDVKLTIKDNL